MPSHSRAPRRFGQVALIASAMVVSLVLPTVVHADDLQDVSKLVNAGKVEEADKRADAFLAKSPKDAQMRFLKGVILAQQGKRPEAIAMFTGITQDFPELPEPYNNLAVIYAAQGDYDKARAALETAIRVSPNYANAHENLGDVYAALAARSYQDARRYDAGNAGALRKLDAAKALLTGAPAAAATATPTATQAATATVPTPETLRSQRNVGLQSPAGPRVTIGGTGAVAPEIVVAADAASVPQGSNVVAIETRPGQEPADTSVLAGAKTVVGADPVQPIDAVTAAVQRWASSRAVTTDNLRIRVDGDVAVARFRQSARSGKVAAANKVLTLKHDGATWTVTEERTES